MGKPGFPISLLEGCALTFPGAGAWGNPVFPHPSPRAYVHIRPHTAAPHTNGINIRLFRGGLRPPKPFHWMRGWGNLVSPAPCSKIR